MAMTDPWGHEHGEDLAHTFAPDGHLPVVSHHDDLAHMTRRPKVVRFFDPDAPVRTVIAEIFAITAVDVAVLSALHLFGVLG